MNCNINLLNNDFRRIVSRREFLNETIKNVLLLTIGPAIYSCASKKPYLGTISSNFSELEYLNPKLAKELRKLPEVKNESLNKSHSTLDAIVDLYKLEPKKFSMMFDIMYSIGLPEKREYCSALQALFWCIEDNKIKFAKDIISDFDLNLLLNESWFTLSNELVHQRQWLINEAEKLEKNCIDKKLREDIERFRKDNFDSTDYTIELAIRYPDKFQYTINNQIYLEWHKKNIKRWKDFNTVVKRLNGKELIFYYGKRNIAYYPGYYKRRQSPRDTFNSKMGQCNEQGRFALYCLIKNGYSFFDKKSLTTAVTVRGYMSEFEGYIGHVGCIVRDKTPMFYKIDTSSAATKGLGGPYKSLEDAAFSVYSGRLFSFFDYDNFYWHKCKREDLYKISNKFKI